MVVLQHDQLEDLRTRIVAPLMGLDESAPIDRLAPEAAFEERRYRVAFHRMAALDQRDLEPVGHLDLHDYMMRAADMIFAGI